MASASKRVRIVQAIAILLFAAGTGLFAYSLYQDGTSPPRQYYPVRT